jgi:hypothetical protein
MKTWEPLYNDVLDELQRKQKSAAEVKELREIAERRK